MLSIKVDPHWAEMAESLQQISISQGIWAAPGRMCPGANWLFAAEAYLDGADS